MEREQGMDIRTYFGRHRPGKPDITIRCINAIMRSGIETMDELCGKDEEHLMRIRNFGQKCLEHTLALREKYALEKNNNQRGNKSNEYKKNLRRNTGDGASTYNHPAYGAGGAKRPVQETHPS
jgi:hypothetical protein